MKAPQEVAELSFRLADPADALCVSALGTQVFFDTYATEGVRPALAREAAAQLSESAIAAQIASPACAFVLAERSGHLVAYAHTVFGAAHELVDAAPACELKRLYVQERFTRKGIGRALLREVQVLAGARGLKSMWLTAWVGNSRALSFYAAEGFTDVGATPYAFEGESHENRVLVKLLAV